MKLTDVKKVNVFYFIAVAVLLAIVLLWVGYQLKAVSASNRVAYIQKGLLKGNDTVATFDLEKTESETNHRNSIAIFVLFPLFIVVIVGLIFIIVRNQKIRNAEIERFIQKQQMLLQYARSLIEASLDPLFTISVQGKITDMNNATVNLIGQPRAALLNTDFFDYFTEPQKAKQGYEEVYAKGFVTEYPLTIKAEKQTEVHFNGSVYKDQAGNVLGAVVVARDFADQKRVEKELIEAKELAEIATKVAERATSIAEEAKSKAEIARRLAEDSVRAKQQFLSNMSHEIRTPMNAIIGFTKVVLKSELTPKQKEYLTAIKMSGDALILLINDILDLAKVDAGKMTFEQTPFKLALSISAMLHLFETKMQEKNLALVKEFDGRIPEVLVGDPVHLQQIINNLVSNAVKFTSKGTITVGLQILSEDTAHIDLGFSVSDTGIGIPEAKIDLIFENFQQATSGTSRLYGGTGLGLAIVKQLVESQGGKIEVQSKPKEGSKFSFNLRFTKTSAKVETEVEMLEIDVSYKNIKVLVVEDMALNQLLMKTILDDFGFERDIAENGKIAIEKMQAKTYDIVLMDLQMPVMNGFEATNYIRNTLYSQIPIIALTADVTTVDLAKCKAVGMNDYISKPVDEKLLYSKIIGFLKKPIALNSTEPIKNSIETSQKAKSINLNYLKERTKSDTQLMMRIISIYLQQTPLLLESMKLGCLENDWHLLYSASHKMIPSFAMMGMNDEHENKAKLIQKYAGEETKMEEIKTLVPELDYACSQACKELEAELMVMESAD